MLICWRYHQSWMRALQQNLELWREILQPFSGFPHPTRVGNILGQTFAENFTNNPFCALQLKPSHHHQAERPQYEVILTFHWLFGFNTEKRRIRECFTVVVSPCLCFASWGKVNRKKSLKSTEKKYEVDFWYWKCFWVFHLYARSDSGLKLKSSSI